MCRSSSCDNRQVSPRFEGQSPSFYWGQLFRTLTMKFEIWDRLWCLEPIIKFSFPSLRWHRTCDGRGLTTDQCWGYIARPWPMGEQSVLTRSHPFISRWQLLTSLSILILNLLNIWERGHTWESFGHLKGYWKDLTVNWWSKFRRQKSAETDRHCRKIQTNIYKNGIFADWHQFFEVGFYLNSFQRNCLSVQIHFC